MDSFEMYLLHAEGNYSLSCVLGFKLYIFLFTNNMKKQRKKEELITLSTVQFSIQICTYDKKWHCLYERRHKGSWCEG